MSVTVVGTAVASEGMSVTVAGTAVASLFAACLCLQFRGGLDSLQHSEDSSRSFGSTVALVGGMLVFGALQTISSKLMYQTMCPSLSSGRSLYNKPWLTLLFMFGGEMSLLAHRDVKKVTGQFPVGETAPAFIFLGPAICDVLGTGLGLMALMFIDAAVWQMLRGSVVVFTTLFSVVLLGRKFDTSHWFGITISVMALFLIGLATILEKPPVSPVGSGQTSLGVFLVVSAQVFTAVQNIAEERILKNYAVSSAHVVGMEGMWGFGLTGAMLFVMTNVHGPDNGVYQSMPDAMHMIRGSGDLLGCIIVYVISTGAYNFVGMRVCRKLSAVTRCLVDAMRTVVVWGFQLWLYHGISNQYGHPWTPFSGFRLVGLCLLATGACVFNHLLRTPMLSYTSSRRGSPHCILPATSPSQSPTARQVNIVPFFPQKGPQCTDMAVDAVAGTSPLNRG